ncbi:hypothetical protein [Campylobacter troglodytis]|uniref:hypothetical protein n=1 Tax=Campylobacter troglodytis TaxID=654363 RepID=UPI00163CD4D4|nr:hypothetical protein [Campylobacter troglodytis]
MQKNCVAIHKIHKTGSAFNDKMIFVRLADYFVFSLASFAKSDFSPKYCTFDLI